MCVVWIGWNVVVCQRASTLSVALRYTRALFTGEEVSRLALARNFVLWDMGPLLQAIQR